MADEKEQKEVVPVDETALSSVNTQALAAESLDLINKIIATTDPNLTKDLTYLFNVNQNKKTMGRQNKLNELLDIITDEAISRFSTHPEEIANQEVFQGLKTVADMIERGQKQINGANEAPLIQINQQKNEVNLGDGTQLPRASREKVKAFVLQALQMAKATGNIDIISEETPEEPDVVIEAEEETKNDN